METWFFCGKGVGGGVSQPVSITNAPLGLTFTAAFIRGQLVARVALTLVASQRVNAALLTATIVGPRTLIHLYTYKQRNKKIITAATDESPSTGKSILL